MRPASFPFAVLVSVLVALMPVAHAAGADSTPPLPAFPGAEGFGATTPGGRGGRVIEVTTLAADGPGSLRSALREKGARVVVFRVGGIIELEKDINVDEPFVTIAGQTAPGDGICLRGAALRLNTHDVIVRYLRVRVGDNPRGPNPENRDAIGIGSQRTEVHHVVIDHCSVSWAIDENIQIWYPCHDITIQWCIISESLEHSLHPKGAHGMGLLIGDHARRVSVHHNLFAHNMDRNPLLKGDTETEVINNVVYNWRWQGVGVTDLEGSGTHRVDIIANVFLPGPQTKDRLGITLYDSVKEKSAVHVRDNLGPRRASNSAADDEWSAVLNRSTITCRSDERVLSGDRVAPDAVNVVRERVLAGAGATRPRRDSVDARVVQSVRDGTGQLIDSQTQVGGWPAYRTAEPAADADHDGIADAWETAHGLTPADASDGMRTAPSGYSWLEEFLNELAR